MNEKKLTPVWIRILPAVFSLLAALAIVFVIWGSTHARPMPEALAALQSDSQVTISTGPDLVFTPAGSPPTTGFILYPGGWVDYRAYSPAAHAIAEQGFLVVIVRMPLNLAVLDPGAAGGVIAAYPEIQHWAVGGHSLGGAMAANFASSHPVMVNGLVLWAAYPASNNDLSASGVKVVSISGSRDGLSTPGKIAASARLLPAETYWVTIEGGNHAGFGWYGPQAGDNPAMISRQDQQQQIVQATVEFLQGLK